MYTTKGKRIEKIKDVKRDRLYILLNPETPFFIPNPYDEIFSNYLHQNKGQSRSNQSLNSASQNVGYSRSNFSKSKLLPIQYSPTIQEMGKYQNSTPVLKYPKETQTSEQCILTKLGSRDSINSAGSKLNIKEVESPVKIFSK